MEFPHDPWANPELAKARPKGRPSWRSGRRRVLRVLVATGIAYAIYTLIAGEHGIVRIRALEREEARLRAEIAATEARIREHQDRLDHIDRTIEEKARIEYGYIGPNEISYEVVPADSAEALLRRGLEEREAGARPPDPSIDSP